jgi:hypothetical protein
MGYEVQWRSIPKVLEYDQPFHFFFLFSFLFATNFHNQLCLGHSKLFVHTNAFLFLLNTGKREK